MSNGETIVIKGEIRGSEDLTIAGRVEGSIDLAGRVLTLAPGSHVNGTITAGTIVASGEVEGRISASVRLQVSASAVVSGELSAATLLIADGAVVNATVEMPVRDERAVA